MVIALPELLAIAGLLLALGMVTMGDAFTKALFQVAETGVGWIPWVGKKAANGVAVVRKRVDNYFSTAALKLQGAISDSWHVLAVLIEQTGDALWKATQLGAKALWYVEVKYPLDVISALAHRASSVVHRTVKVTTTQVTRLTKVQGISTKQWRHVLRRLAYLSVLVAALSKAIAHAPTLPRPTFPDLARPLKGIRARLRRLERINTRKGAAAFVAAALGTLGLSWMRRSCVKRNNDLLCKTDFGALEGLLGGLVLIAGTQSVVRFANAMLAVEDEMVGVLESMVVELGELK